jgi:phosphatidylinositol dimannoside acyltransferase
MWLLRSLKVAAVLTPLVPARVGYVVCWILATLFYLINRTARRNILENLQRVTPGAAPLTRLRTALRVCYTVVSNYYDLLRIRSVDRGRVAGNVEIKGLEHVQRALGYGRGVIIVSGHIGNFSVMAKLPASLGMKTAVVAERVEPPELFHYMARLRSAMDIQVIPPETGSLRRIVDLLNDNGVLLLAADRDVTNQGLPVTLFGEETRLPAGPVMLASRTGAALIPGFTNRRSDGISTVELRPPIELVNTANRSVDDLINIRQLARQLETMIAVDPGQWAVLQRIWPPQSTYGRSEGLGSGAFDGCEDQSEINHEH